MRGLRPGLSAAAAIAIGGAVLVAAPGAMAAPDEDGIVINEVNYDDAHTGEVDAVEFYNPGASPVDISGWSLHDDKDRPGEADIPEGTVVGPGEYFVMLGDEQDFPFGLGKGDSVVLKNAAGAVVDRLDYENTAPIAVWARCPDGTGDWAHADELTLGGPNDCEQPEPEPVDAELVLNEIDSGPSDWIEFVNPGDEALDLAGYEVRDNSDDHRWRFPDGASIAAGEHLVVDAKAEGLFLDGAEWKPGTFESAIGIGSGDSIRVYDPSGELVQEHSWTEHANIDGDEAAATLGRCPDATGPFALAFATPGEANECVAPAVAINEIESNGDTNDWVEVINTGGTAVDISGWTVMDDDPIGHANDTKPLPEGTVLEPGALFVFDENAEFAFGLGSGDTATLRDAAGKTVDEHTWNGHANGSLQRCPDGTGEFADVEVSTKGRPNACGNPVVLNEIESSDASDGEDWIELANPASEPLDVSGLVIKDDDDAHAYELPEGTSIEVGGYLVLTESEFGFGLGGSDSVRIYEGGTLVESAEWEGHAAETWGRCPDLTGEFAVTAEPTPGAANSCPGIPGVEPWPGADEVAVVDEEPMFLEDSSGLDFHEGALWAVDNGTGTIWKLDAERDGSVAFAEGWEDGKRVRFQSDDPTSAGPDAEGITLAGDGTAYLAVERDNSDKGTNFNAILGVDPEQPGPDIVADREWDLTDSLPAVSANMGIEAVEWVSNDVLEGVLIDERTGEAFDPADYPGAVSDGVFFVALEDNGHVYAYVLGEDGSAEQIADIDPRIGGAMGLDYDEALGVLWVESDDGYDGRLAQVSFVQPAVAQAAAVEVQPGVEVVHVDRPASMPNVNNEGFATSPADYCVDGQRPAWWFEDGVTSGALRTAPLECAPVDDGSADDTADGGQDGDDTAAADGGEDAQGAAEGGQDADGSADAGADGSADAGAEGTGDAAAADGATAGGSDSGAAAQGTADGAASDGEDGSTEAGDLARTGADGLTWVIIAGVVLVALGALLFFLRRRSGKE